MTKETAIKRLVKAVFYLRGTIDAMDSEEVPRVDADLADIFKGRKCSVEQDASTLNEILEHFGVKE